MRVEHLSAIGGESRRRWVLVVALMTASLLLVAIPAGAAPSGTVDATVSVEGPCITVSATSVDFGALGFNQPSTFTVGTAGSFNVTNCSSQGELFYLRASDAVGDVSGSWTLNQWEEGVTGSSCVWGTDFFGAGLTDNGGNSVWLSSSADSTDLIVHAGGAIKPVVPKVLMPCVGSSGVGETMAFTYTITGVLP